MTVPVITGIVQSGIEGINAVAIRDPLVAPDQKSCFQMTLPNSQYPVREITEQILATRRITRSDQQRLMMSLLAKEALSPEDRAMIDRIFDQLHRGLLHVVD